MASGVAETESAPSVFDDEGRGDGGISADAREGKKSRKFKPFEAMRKLFKGGRKQRKSKDEGQANIGSVKAKSTTALTGADDDEDDSDGGFKSHPPKPLQGGNRSISEDSVFSPGDREPATISALKSVAVSEENIHNKNAFQNELFSKLKQRNSQYSDDDDAGLPQSPVPPITTADVIGEPLKPNKSSSRESEKSLISVDGSDNEDDLFLSGWTGPIKPKQSGPQSPQDKQSMDFAAVKSTASLDNEAARHKRAIRPRRTQAKQSRKNRESLSSSGLPRLSEESPTKVLMEESTTSADVSQMESSADASMLEITTKPGTADKPKVALVPKPQPKPSDAGMKTVVSVSSTKPDAKKEPAPAAAAAASVKVSHETDVSRARSSSLNVKDKAEPAAEAGQKPSELSQALGKLKKPEKPLDKPEVGSPGEPEVITFPVKKEEKVGDEGKAVSGLADKAKMFKTEEEPKPDKQPSEDVKIPKDEDLKPVSKPLEEIKSTKSFDSDKNVSKTVISTSGEIKQNLTKQLSNESAKDSSETKPAVTSGRSESFRKEPQAGAPTPSPKEDYKLRRQARSKTLPGQPVLPGEQVPVNVIVKRANSTRMETSPKLGLASNQRQSAYNPTPSSKKPEPKRLSMIDMSPTLSGEPEWMALVRRKKAESAEKEAKSGGVVSNVDSNKKEVLTFEKKEIVITEKKDSEKPVPGDKHMGSSSVIRTESMSKSDGKKIESVGISSSRSTSVRTPSKAGSDITPARFGSVKVNSAKPTNTTPTTTASKLATSVGTNKPVNISSSASNVGKSVNNAPTSISMGKSVSNAPTSVSMGKSVNNAPTSISMGKSVNNAPTSISMGKSVNITPSASSVNKSVNSTTPVSSVSKPSTPSVISTSKSGNVTQSSPSKSGNVVSSSSTRPDSIRNFGSKEQTSVTDTKTVSPTEEARKVFSRGQSQSVKTSTALNIDSNKISQSRMGSTKTPSSIKIVSSSSAKGSVQSTSLGSEKSESTSVPAWRSGLQHQKEAKPVHIEIIEKEKEVPKVEAVNMRKKTPPAQSSDSNVDSCRDTTSNRSSKVLDMVKNFQKLQVS